MGNNMHIANNSANEPVVSKNEFGDMHILPVVTDAYRHVSYI